ncbi:unnamed protein product [Soboliphyme baturini]|uniref:VWFD domain-containing protein n=1 Tax=Soboliphyme baturini TaxID=241478 RepID=A0A183IJ95_9BILA|nr:unnamed protein product [Soboliphyme baturini]
MVQTPVANILNNLRKIESCSVMHNQPGYYMISGDVAPVWYIPACMLYLVSPAGSEIEIEVMVDDFNCRTSEIILFDGWYLVDRVTHKITPVPEDLSRNSSRIYNACDSSKRMLRTSQNFAEVVYDLKPLQWIVIKVDFRNQRQGCDMLLPEAAGEYMMSNNGHAGVCRWYVTGSVVLDIMDTNLNGKSQVNVMQTDHTKNPCRSVAA